MEKGATKEKISIPNEYNLTDRDRFIINRTAQGFYVDDVAEEIGVSYSNCAMIKSRICDKMKATNMVEVVHHLHEMKLWDSLIREEESYG